MVNEPTQTVGRPRRAEYTTQDFLDFREAGTLSLTPKFQRRAVWKLPQRSYFLDTLIRGLPVPPIYLRETQRDDKRGVVREVVDGQQRLRTVLDFVDGNYSISRSLPAPWAGLTFGKLEEDQQDQINNFHFACEVFGGISDAAVLNIFARLNTYSVQLNRQELRNGRWFGHFKQCCYDLAYEYIEFWRSNRVFTEDAIARMLEVELTSELVILGLTGVQDKKDSIDRFYADFDEAFPARETAQSRFRATMTEVSEALSNILPQTNFRRVPLFYSLFGAVQHRLYGVKGVNRETRKSRLSGFERANLASAVELLSGYLAAVREDHEQVPAKYQSFVTASLRQTDNIGPRLRRLEAVYDEAKL